MQAAHGAQNLDYDLQTLCAGKAVWARLPVARKIAMLDGVKRNVHALAGDWVRAACNAKGLLQDSPLAGEEWISGPWAVLYALNRYRRTLAHIDIRGEPKLPPMTTRGERTIVHAFPHDAYDRLLLSGVRADVWMQPGVTRKQTQARAASFYREPQPGGRLALVLGAGNISSIAPLDVLYKLIARGAVCMLKMNPVNDYLGPIFERAFEPFVDAGFVRLAYGDAAVGEYLCRHPEVEEIHITGSERTHDAIVASAGAKKTITSELGNVSPTIVVPGPWNADDLRFQAENIATQKAHNAGFNCIAAQVLVLPRRWEHSRALRDRVLEVFGGMEQRPEYYPGARARRSALAGESSALRTIVDVDAEDVRNAALTGEAFCGVLACIEIDGTPGEFVRNAVTFANDRLRGTLGANLIAHPKTLRDPAAGVEQAIVDLRYGCIGVNAWTGVGYFINETPWGAYPGHTYDDIGSGIGVVHNSYLLEDTEKTVVRAPFRPFPRSMRGGEFTLLPKPPWFVTNRLQHEIGRALCDFEMTRTPAAAAKVAALALRG